MEAGSAGVYGDGVLRPDICGEQMFKTGDFGTFGEPPGAQGIRHFSDFILADRRQAVWEEAFSDCRGHLKFGADEKLEPESNTSIPIAAVPAFQRQLANRPKLRQRENPEAYCESDKRSLRVKRQPDDGPPGRAPQH